MLRKTLPSIIIEEALYQKILIDTVDLQLILRKEQLPKFTTKDILTPITTESMLPVAAEV
jgi:hypothetical protein